MSTGDITYIRSERIACGNLNVELFHTFFFHRDRADPAVVRQWDLAAGTVTAEWPMAANSAGGGGWSGLALVESPTTAAAGGGEGEKQAEAELLLLEASPPPQIWRVGMTQTAGAAGGTAPNSGGAGGRAVGKRLACTPGRSAV